MTPTFSSHGHMVTFKNLISSHATQWQLLSIVNQKFLLHSSSLKVFRHLGTNGRISSQIPGAMKVAKCVTRFTSICPGSSVHVIIGGNFYIHRTQRQLAHVNLKPQNEITWGNRLIWSALVQWNVTFFSPRNLKRNEKLKMNLFPFIESCSSFVLCCHPASPKNVQVRKGFNVAIELNDVG